MKELLCACALYPFKWQTSHLNVTQGNSRVVAGSIRIRPQCSCSRCFCPHTCLHQDRPVLRSGPAEPDTRAPSAESERRETKGLSAGWYDAIWSNKILNYCHQILLSVLGFGVPFTERNH